MIKVNIFSNTENWRIWRHKGIGASDIPVIMGFSKYKTKDKLFLEKIQPEPPKIKKNFITELGHICEAEIRPVIELETGLNLPSLLFEDEKDSYYKVSLDGFDEDKKIVWENKLVGKTKYKFLENGVIPDEFMSQVQYQLYITKAKYALLTSVLYNSTTKKIDYKTYKTLNIKPHKKIQDKILKAVNLFKKDVEAYKNGRDTQSNP